MLLILLWVKKYISNTTHIENVAPITYVWISLVLNSAQFGSSPNHGFLPLLVVRWPDNGNLVGQEQLEVVEESKECLQLWGVGWF